MSNESHIAKVAFKLLWRAISKINFLPYLVSILLIIIILILLIPYVINDQFILYDDKGLTLSLLGSILAGSIVFLTIQFFSKLLLSSTKVSNEIYYKDMFIDNGLETIFDKRGINIEYAKRISKSKKRIWAIGMTNGNLIKHQLENILKQVAFRKEMDVIISFWAPNTILNSNSSPATFQPVSIINQQLKIEDGKTISPNIITDRIDSIKKRYEAVKTSKTGNLKILESSLPSSFTCFIIDEDIFFFPYLSTVESTSSPTILCNINRGIGKVIFEHFEITLKSSKVSKELYKSS